MMGEVKGFDMFEVVLFSFGFKYGLPEDATMIWDVRFLPNPYWENDMRHLTGHDSEVAAYVLESEGGKGFLSRFSPLLSFLIEENSKAGKKGMRIGIGCTGGHHRSVAVVEKLAELLRNEPVRLQVYHRDIEKE
jgi:UPF0042 nucleotide-binding protein